MSTILIEIRRAKASDAAAVAATHDEAWRTAYQGIIPGTELEKLINRRGPEWWDSAIRKGSRIAILRFGDTRRGLRQLRPQPRAQPVSTTARSTSSTCGRNSRASASAAACSPRARRDLAQSGLKAWCVGAVGQRARGGILSRARRPRGGALLGEIRRPACSTRSPSPGGLEASRLGRLAPSPGGEGWDEGPYSVDRNPSPDLALLGRPLPMGEVKNPTPDLVQSKTMSALAER